MFYPINSVRGHTSVVLMLYFCAQVRSALSVTHFLLSYETAPTQPSPSSTAKLQDSISAATPLLPAASALTALMELEGTHAAVLGPHVAVSQLLGVICQLLIDLQAKVVSKVRLCHFK